MRSTSPQAARVVSKRLVDGLDGRLQVVLDDSVKLELLAGGDPEGTVAVSRGEVVVNEVLPRGELTARNAGSDHERVGLFLALSLELDPEVAVVLLVGAVELQDRCRVLADVRGLLGKLLGQEPLEVLTGRLQPLDLARFARTRHPHDLPARCRTAESSVLRSRFECIIVPAWLAKFNGKDKASGNGVRDAIH